MIADGWHHALGHQFAVSVEPAVDAAGSGWTDGQAQMVRW